MLFLLRPSIVFVLFIALALVPGAWLASRGAHARFEAARRRTDADCRAYRKAHPTAHVCNFDRYAPSTIKPFEAQKKELEVARRAAAHGDTAAAVETIRRALDVGATLDERGTLIGALVDAALVNESLDIIEKNPGAFPPALRAEIARHARIRSAAQPLETERIERLWFLSLSEGGIDEDAFRLLPRSPFEEAYLADAMLQDDAIFAEMDRAIAADDVPRCQAAARGRVGFRAGTSDYLCEMVARVVRTDARAKKMSEEAVTGIGLPTPPPSR